MIPQETVNLILDTARIEEVVGDFVTLKRRGANYVACCPFHEEKTPSFYVSPAKGIYKCFGCGKAGSAVGFVMEHEHCSYTEALRYMAKRYNIEVVEEELSPEEEVRRQRSESLLLVSEFAQKFFAGQLESGEGKDVAMAYYHSRKLEDETIARFGLGWAPSGKTDLLDAARAAGYKEEYLLDAGLVVKREDGTLADKFRERVMFPIHSVSGRVIAFSGRTLRSDNPAKYVNSPDTEIYKKSNILFGIWFAKQAIAKEDRCIIVEGNVDLVMLHQLGICNVVAPCGTALTVQQVRLIRKFTKNVVLMNDGDSAGIHASLKDIDMLLAEDMDVTVVLLPEGEDPDSFARAHTLEEVQDYIKNEGKDFLTFKTDILLGEAAGDPLRKANFVNDCADTIARIPDAVKRSVFVDAAARKFDVSQEILFTRVNATRSRLLEEEKREREREARASGEPQAQETEVSVAPSPTPSNPQKYIPEDPIVSPVEKELLGFLLCHGCDPMEFETDSRYYDPEGEPMTVAEFISAAIDETGEPFYNSQYRDLYDKYLELYDEGMEQSEIVRRLMDSPDRITASIVAELSMDKYPLTLKSLSNSMTAVPSWLAAQVPKTLLYLGEKRAKSTARRLQKSMKGVSPEEEQAILAEIMVQRRKEEKYHQKIAKEEYK